MWRCSTCSLANIEGSLESLKVRGGAGSLKARREAGEPQGEGRGWGASR